MNIMKEKGPFDGGRNPLPPAFIYDEPLMTDVEVAKMLSVSVGLVRKWRLKKTGPRYQKVGRLVRYRLEEIQGWLKSREVGTEE